MHIYKPPYKSYVYNQTYHVFVYMCSVIIFNFMAASDINCTECTQKQLAENMNF